MNIFIDTEFTDFIKPQLISMGLVAASGEEFYAEVPFLEISCSTFVKEVVIPLLGKQHGAVCSKDELRERLITWLELVRPRNEALEICFYFQTDWDLFANALGGSIPIWCQARLIGREINELLRYDFHKRNQLPEHHALYDARAIRYAFRERPPVIF
ncbi:3'-5' exoribonuclease [Undibacterium rugosum]|uniref:3'-5' exoribonuclease n=1 Tax=Undibacterium rugosum TaxID=2762291 RepID=UPI001B82471F|nr:3'-5' exoribonuclease [Undibacterium rugosum]MBR7780231.1 3'-5' exoribonuclease [Undibacterium rugosum]